MIRHPARALALAIAALTLMPFAASAQLVVSAQDGKATLVDGVNVVPPSPVADYAAIIDLGATPPKVIGEVPAPASVVGPPQSVAIASDQSIALVTGAMKVDPADPKKLVPNNALTIIDLKSSPPKVLATLEAGLGAAGVSINKAGTLALVANRSEGRRRGVRQPGRRAGRRRRDQCHRPRGQAAAHRRHHFGRPVAGGSRHVG